MTLETKMKTVNIAKNTTSSSWVLQCIQQIVRLQSPFSRQLTIIANFYTQHNFGRALKTMIDGEIALFGTFLVANLSGKDRKTVRHAVDGIRDAASGDYFLCQLLKRWRR